MRLALFLWARGGGSRNFDQPSETLARLHYAYANGMGSSLSQASDGMEHDPHRGYRLKGGQHSRTFGPMTFSTNGRGMRGAAEYSVPKPAAVTRIVALGDSMTFGFDVDDDSTWPAQLARALPGTEVANLGEPAFAHDQMYFSLVDEGIRLQPDAVVLGFFEPDLMRDELTFYSYEKPRFTRRDGEWRIENVPVPTPRELSTRMFAIPALYAVPRALIETLEALRGVPPSPDDRGYEILRRMRATAEAAGARFVVVRIPEHPEQEPWQGGFFARYCASSGAECVDPWPLFRTLAGTDSPAVLRERYQLPNDMHYARAGYAVVVEALVRHFAAHPLGHAHD